MNLLQQVAELTGVKAPIIVLLDAATIGLFLHPSPTTQAVEHWIEVGLKWSMMIVAIAAHIYTIRRARKEKNQP